MFFYPSTEEGLAWLEASDASWGARAGGWYEDAGGTFRRDDEAAEDPAP